MPPVDGGPCGPSPWQTLFLTVHNEITEPPGPCDVHLVIPFKSGPHVDVQGISLAARDTFWKRSKGPGRTASGCDLVHEPAQVCQAVQRGHTPQAAVFRAVPAIWRQSSCHSCPVVRARVFWHSGIRGSFLGHREVSCNGTRTPTVPCSFPKWDAGVLSVTSREIGEGGDQTPRLVGGGQNCMQ